jgi:tetratricopeptide (TPR) repeat protein
MEELTISHYRIVRRIARGGMGEVYEAVDLDLDRTVALKFIAPELTARPESLRRFEQEARSAAALNHPHIATVYAFDRTTDRPLLAMELLTGETLRNRLESGPVSLPEALAWARDAASALAHAHHRSVIHRDVKPENLMFDEHGRIKVTDFGLAKAAAGSGLTMTGATLGTAGYMAPEAVEEGSFAPADVFALGVVLYEMISGRLPFEGDSPLAILYKIANETPAPLRDSNPEVPDDVQALVNRVLAKKPQERPSAEEAWRELTRLTGLPSPPLEATAESTAPVMAHTSPVTRPAARPAGRTALRVRIAGGVLLALGLGALAVNWGRAQSARKKEEAVALNNRGIEALQRGEADRAQALFRSALEKNSGYGEAMINLGIILQEQGQVQQAESLFTSVVRRFGHDPRLMAQARYNLGGIDLDARAYESAAANLEQSFALDSSTARVYNNYGLSLVRVGRAGEGLGVLQRGIRRFPTVAPLHKNAGLAALDLGRYEEALAHLDRALELDPSLTEAQTLRAEVLRRRE